MNEDYAFQKLQQLIGRLISERASDLAKRKASELKDKRLSSLSRSIGEDIEARVMAEVEQDADGNTN